MPAGYTLKVVSKKTKVWNLFKGDYKDAKKIDFMTTFLYCNKWGQHENENLCKK